MTRVRATRSAWAAGIMALATASCSPGAGKSARVDTVFVHDSAHAAAGAPAGGGGDDVPGPTGDAGDAGVELYPAALLDRIGDSLSHTPRTGHVLRSHSTFETIEGRRVANGTPEVHDAWTDVMVVQAGRATLLLGGRVSGGSATGAGEHRGGSIAGGSPRAIGTGDLIVIPAGTPHQFQVTRGDSIRYLTIKVPR